MLNDPAREETTTPQNEGMNDAGNRAERKGLALASLITGCVAFLTGLIPVVGLLAGIAAIVTGVIALATGRRKWFSVVGISLGAVGALCSILMTVAISIGGFLAEPASSPAPATIATVEIPDVEGMTAEEAVAKLEDLGLTVAVVDEASRALGNDSFDDRLVSETNPPAGSKAELGSEVTVTLDPVVVKDKPKKAEKADPKPKKTEPKPKPKPTEAPKEAEKPNSAETPAPPKIEVLDLSYEGNRYVSATFPVSDAFTKAGVTRNLKEGCVEAIQAAKEATPEWYAFDTVQCMGMMDETILVGSANFSGALLSEISDVAMQDDPEGFWAAADRSNIAPAFQ